MSANGVEKRMMEKNLRGGLIGCGYASTFQLEAWKRIDEVEITALSNRTLERAEQRAEDYRIRSVYADYLEMMDNEELDFVDIAVPPEIHLEIIRAAAARGLNILCQKPIAGTLSELQEMMDVCREAGVRFMVNENGRFQPWFRKMKEYLDAGIPGDPLFTSFSSQCRMTLPHLDAGTRSGMFGRMPRLIIFELGVHFLDVLRFLYGEPESVYAVTNRASREIAGEDVASILLRYGDHQAVVEMSWASLPARDSEAASTWGEFRIEGRRGTLLLERNANLKLITEHSEENCQFPQDGELLGYVGAQEHFARCLKSGEPFETSGEETYRTMELVFGSYYSAQSNSVYRVGVDLEKISRSL